MAGGPIFPFSVYPVTADQVFFNLHTCAGSNAKHFYGLGYKASVSADGTWRMMFKMPPVLPSGTGKLILPMLANATAGIARLNPKWKSWAAGEDPSSAALNAEGVTPDSKSGQAGSGDTMEWGSGDNDQILVAKWILNADTLVADEYVALDLVGETASWTLAQILTCLMPHIAWES